MKIDSFSSYERDVLHLLAKGEKNAEIAKALCVSGKYSKIPSEKYLSEAGCKEQKPGYQSDHGVSYTIKKDTDYPFGQCVSFLFM